LRRKTRNLGLLLIYTCWCSFSVPCCCSVRACGGSGNAAARRAGGHRARLVAGRTICCRRPGSTVCANPGRQRGQAGCGAITTIQRSGQLHPDGRPERGLAADEIVVGAALGGSDKSASATISVCAPPMGNPCAQNHRPAGIRSELLSADLLLLSERLRALFNIPPTSTPTPR